MTKTNDCPRTRNTQAALQRMLGIDLPTPLHSVLVCPRCKGLYRRHAIEWRCIGHGHVVAESTLSLQVKLLRAIEFDPGRCAAREVLRSDAGHTAVLKFWSVYGMTPKILLEKLATAQRETNMDGESRQDAQPQPIGDQP